MVCPYCIGSSRIVNSRKSAKRALVWRRHRCLSCGADFTTYESIDYTKAYVVTDGKHVEPFQPSVLLISIFKALDHRPKAAIESSALCDEVCARLLKSKQATLERTAIQIEVMHVLKLFDSVAAIKYQSTHEQLSSYRDVRRVLKRD